MVVSGMYRPRGSRHTPSKPDKTARSRLLQVDEPPAKRLRTEERSGLALPRSVDLYPLHGFSDVSCLGSPRV